MSKPFGNVHLQIVFVGEFDCNILSEGGGTRSNIQRHIQNATAYRTHEFGLGVFALLKMQPSQCASPRKRGAVLRKVNFDAERNKRAAVV